MSMRKLATPAAAAAGTRQSAVPMPASRWFLLIVRTDTPGSGAFLPSA
ncbi:hypothetical protein [Natronorubrum sp. DTA7]